MPGKRCGINLIAVSKEQTIFPTIPVPEAGQYDEYLQLAAAGIFLLRPESHLD